MDIVQIILYMIILLALAAPLGLYMAKVYAGERSALSRVFGRFERLIYRLLSTGPDDEMNVKRYIYSVLAFSVFGILLTILIQLIQQWLPFNPAHERSVSFVLALNTAVSFVTNTNWQAYGGETTLSYLTQMVVLTVQNFVSAAAGMAVLVALIRGLTRTDGKIGNFWVDLTRSTLYILLPLSIILGLLLVSQGVVQDLKPYLAVHTLDPTKGNTIQSIALGPAASQIAIKQLGTNGGGFFNVNSAHPFENPTPLSNFLELLSILLIPASLCVTFGQMVRNRSQGRAILIAMTVVFVVFLSFTYAKERQGTVQLTEAGADMSQTALQSGGNMEGKEVRFGIANSALWATATTAASNGSVNSMHDSYTPLGGLGPMLLMQLGEVIYGGVGSGLYSMLLFAILAVFIAGLMVGRTPEYLGKKIGPFEMKMASFAALLTPILALLGTAVAVVWPGISESLNNPGPHGFSEILYAYSSAANNNGSAFAGLNANTPFLNISLAAVMFLGRFGVMFATIAAAGSLAQKKVAAHTSGTLPTDGPLFIGLLISVVLVVGALSFFPALALGPIAEQLLTQLPGSH